MQKALPFIMNLRIRTKDVGLALLKLDKLPLQNLRKVGKSTVGGSRDSSSEDASCDKCKRIIDKSFSVDLRRVSTDNNESRKDKLETIVEHPLVEAEPRVDGMDVMPKLLGSERFKQPMDRLRQKSFELDNMKGLDELACKLMKLPASQIDSKLLDTCLSARAMDIEQKARTYPIVEDFDSGGVPDYFKHFEGSLGDDSDSPVYIDRYTNLTPLCYRNYDLNLETDSYEKSFKAEKSYPSHLDVEFVMSIHKDPMSEFCLKAFEPIRYEILSYNMMLPPPLPPNETSISSQMKYEEEVRESLTRDRTMPPYMREYKLGRKAEDPSTLRNRAEESYHNYLSSLTSGSATLDHKMGPPKLTTMDHKKQEIPLSQLLKQVRQKNRIAQEMQKKKLKFDPGRFWSKSTCLPPLDLRPKSATCPPKACPPRKQETPPPKAMPCPPPKKSSCPPPAKKGPCPVKANPCDPCKPPPPCPVKKSPCGMYTGNKFKDTITLILCGCTPSVVLRQAIGLPLLYNYSHNLIQGIVKNISTTAASYAIKLKSVKELGVERNWEEARDVYFARSFDPWAPIPSWPEPKKAVKKKLVCPKEGCELPKVAPTPPPCKEFPCSINAADRKR